MQALTGTLDRRSSSPNSSHTAPSDSLTASDFYVFVLTNADRERQLGFCRRVYPRVGAPAPRYPIVLCFLSRKYVPHTLSPCV